MFRQSKTLGFGYSSRQGAKNAKKDPCHFDRREKSFLDPSRSLGMTGLGPSPLRLCVLARDTVFPIFSSSQNFKYVWLDSKTAMVRYIALLAGRSSDIV